jgi:phosphonate transport system substrate-binding protein
MNVFKKAAMGVVAVATILTGPVMGASVFAQATPSAAPVAATPGNYDKTDWPSELNCGLFGGDDTTATLANAQPLADYLSNWLGMPVKYTTGTSYNAVIEAMASNHTNCGTVGPFSYLLGVQEAGAEALGVEVDAPNADNPVYDPTAKPSYYSTIITKKGSGIAHVSDLKGHSFSFVDPASTSGYLMPSNGMIENGIDPEKDIDAIFAGSHPSSGIAVWNDKVDAGAIYEAALVQLAAEGQIDYCGFPDGKVNEPRTQEEIDAVYNACPDGSIVAIYYSAPIPNTPFAVKKDLPQSLKQAIYDALMNMKNEPELIAALGYWYDNPTSDHLDEKALDAYYDPLREVAKNLDLDLQSLGS